MSIYHDYDKVTKPRSTVDYRKIYIKNYGPIPTDEDGRRYDIHHIDGNSFNNDPSNLMAVSIKDHFQLHKERGEWAACYGIAKRMKLSPQEISELSRLNAIRMVEEGIHPWQRRPDGSSLAKDKVKNGTHNFLRRPDGTSVSFDNAQKPDYVNPAAKRPDGTSVSSDRVARGDHNWLKRPDGTSVSSDRVSSGTHNFLRRPDGSSMASDMVKNGTHSWLKKEDGTSGATRQLEKGIHPSQSHWCCLHCGTWGYGVANYNRCHGANCGMIDPEKRVIIDGVRYASVGHAAGLLKKDYRTIRKIMDK